MTDAEWFSFFRLCTLILGRGSWTTCRSQTWCAWTTFSSLEDELNYWKRGLPNLEDIAETHIKDNGVWGQPFLYKDIAHIIIPRTFYWERADEHDFECGTKTQDIDRLSNALTEANIVHRKTDVILEIKLY
jgi:hypothetical protein